ncbi:methylmalonyl-CoA mutase family protein, partial [Sphaerisporangium krabiense]
MIPDFRGVGLTGAARYAPPVAHGDPWQSPEGIPVPPVHTPADLEAEDYDPHTYPGIPPYVRGPYPTMYVTRP